MARREQTERNTEVLEMLLVLQLYAMGMPQTRIARVVGKSTTWVNGMLKGLPKHGRGGN